MATDAILETIKPRRSASREELPVTTAPGNKGGTGGGTTGHMMIGLRRRMSSISVRIRPSTTSGAAEALRRARSMPSSVKALAAAGAVRRWWDWGIGWVRAPFARRGLEMSDDEDEAATLGGRGGRGTWRHVLHKVRAGARRLLGRDGRPRQVAAQDFRYDSVSYAQNFDDGEDAA